MCGWRGGGGVREIVKILVSSVEEKDVDMYMAMNTTRNKIKTKCFHERSQFAMFLFTKGKSDSFIVQSIITFPICYGYQLGLQNCLFVAPVTLKI